MRGSMNGVEVRNDRFFDHRPEYDHLEVEVSNGFGPVDIDAHKESDAAIGPSN